MDSGTGNSLSSDDSQLSKYMLKVEDHHLATSDAFDTMNFWNDRVSIYDKLSLIAQDILAAPASQAYVERGFSVCGLVTAGRRNRMTKSLHASLFESEQKSIGEHRHQRLCVNFGTLTSMGMNCK